jgi:hypothetical protein
MDDGELAEELNTLSRELGSTGSSTHHLSC